ncbi:hypothetical protein D3C84_721860 [compost metagenome]
MTIRVAFVLVTLRNTVERHQQVLALTVLLPMATHAHGQRLDVFGVGMVITNEPHHRQVALFLHRLGPGIEHRGRGADRILRIERQQDHPVDPLGLERLPAILHGG